MASSGNLFGTYKILLSCEFWRSEGNIFNHIGWEHFFLCEFLVSSQCFSSLNYMSWSSFHNDAYGILLGKKAGCKQYLWYMILHTNFYVCVCMYVKRKMSWRLSWVVGFGILFSLYSFLECLIFFCYCERCHTFERRYMYGLYEDICLAKKLEYYFMLEPSLPSAPVSFMEVITCLNFMLIISLLFYMA